MREIDSDALHVGIDGKGEIAAVRDTDMHLRVRAAGKMSENRIKRSITAEEPFEIINPCAGFGIHQDGVIVCHPEGAPRRNPPD